MTKEEFAKMLNGRGYCDELDSSEEKLAKKFKLAVVYGASDDLMEFRGAIDEECSCYDGGTILLTPGGSVLEDHECDCDYCGYKTQKETAQTIEAVWCDPEVGGSWSYKTDIPHATFDIMEDGELYCRGIVFSLDDLKGAVRQ